MAARCLCSPAAVTNSHLSIQKGRPRFSSSACSSFPTQLRRFRIVGANNSGRHGQKKLLIRAAAVDDESSSDGGAESKKGRQLWRSELQSNGELPSEFESAMERDIEQLTKKAELEKLWSQQADGGGKNQAVVDQRGVAVRDIADKILVADFFFILFILGWLLAGLAERTALESTNLIDSWLPLWPSVFQPALGVFMAGAIVSALSKKK